jgi:carbon-monoxide dehydrogenase medium subunit
MYPASFDYVRAESVDHAIRLLGEQADAKLIAGGHSLIPMLKLRLAQPSTLIDIGRIDGLRAISEEGGQVKVGALATHHELATSDVLRRHAPILARAAAKIGDPQVRHRGTLGGNIAHADPASDLPAVLVALNATIHVRGAGGPRAIRAEDFFLGLLSTALEEGELLTHVTLRVLQPGDGSAYLKFEHPASGYAVVGAAAVIRGGKATLAFNGVAESVLCLEPLADLSDAAIDAAVDAVEVDDPLSDIHASGEYRVHLAKVYGKRALKTARDGR